MDVVLLGLRNALQMFWEVWWALVLGFLLSGIVQAWVSRRGMERSLGRNSLGATLKATGLGAVSSSCSYAAIAIGKSMFQKGAGISPVLSFMFASTNLVFEIGIVLWIFLGPAFTAAEFIGGLVLVLLTWLLVRLWVSSREEAHARELARSAESGHQHETAAHRRTLRENLVSLESWRTVAGNFVNDWRMLYKEITIGFLLAGFIALVPVAVFDVIFLKDAPPAVQVVENVLIGPLIAILSFVCSVGNIPLAAVLWASGLSFAGVIAFIYADLITLPIILIYRKYYGWRFALKMVLIMFTAMAGAALLIDLLFSSLGWVPDVRPSVESITDRGITFNYTAVLNIIFAGIALTLFTLSRRHPDNTHHHHESHSSERMPSDV